MRILIFISGKKISILIFLKEKIKCCILILPLLSCAGNIVYGQRFIDTTGIGIRCVLKPIVHDNKDLTARLIIKNTSDSVKLIYKEIIEGTFNEFINNLTNLTVVIQKRSKNKFYEYIEESSADPAPNNDSTDNLLKVKVAPKDSLISYFHIDSRYQFETGEYRMKCIYWNNIHYNHKIESKWVYFKVLKKIYTKHYGGVSE